MQYMEIFYSGQDVGRLRALLSDELEFRGPLYRFQSADAYVDSLLADPPVGMTYRVVESFSTERSACLVYEFEKAGVRTPMVQLFKCSAGKIDAILLVFDTGDFA